MLLTVVLLRLPAGATAHLKQGFGSLFVPLFGLAGSGRHLAEEAGQAVLPRRSLVEENDRLRRENEELKIFRQKAEATLRENERLRAQVAWARTAPWKIRLARVIARDPANWWRTLHIDLGRRDGIHPEAAVLTAEGLVGRVAEVGETRSRVLLLGDPNCRVAALVLEGRQAIDTGIISGGASVIDLSMVDLTYLSHGNSVKPGQAVVTSGLGGVFTNGIRIGQVVDAHSMEYGLYTDARVKLAVNLSQLEEVWVMMP